MIYIIIIGFILNLIFFFILLKKIIKINKKTEEEYKDELKKKFEQEEKELNQKIEASKRDFENQKKIQEERLNFEKEKLDNYKQNLNNLLKIEQENFDISVKSLNEKIVAEEQRLNSELQNKKQLKLLQIETELKEKEEKVKQENDILIQQMNYNLSIEKQKVEDEIKIIQNNLNDYQKKQEVIGKEILRQRMLKEQTNFYRICLSQEQKDDIEILKSIIPKLNKHSNIDKLIYEVYCSKEAQAMIKRVLNNEQPSGIYKITRLKTGEIYIGKSTNIKERWLQHIKTACGCGTIAHSILHTTMEKDGIDNFTFELLEKVEKSKLSEREKYWINFYKSKDYGLNEKNG